MTASSLELFPCQVQLMGLPRSTNSTSTASGSANVGNLCVDIIRQPSEQKIRRVSRNLFGAPDPIEMKNLYQQEAERQRKYILRRYNFDTTSSAETNESNRNENDTNSSFKHPMALPTLIEQEIKQNNQRRQCKTQRLSRTSLEETSPNPRDHNHPNRLFEATRKCCEDMTTLSPAVDLQKPYTRQSLLTERFNIRKSKAFLLRNSKCYKVGETTTKSSEAAKNLEISQILESNTRNSKHEEDTKSVNEKIYFENEDLICKDKSTAVSLQFVVSTQNLS